MIKAIETKYDGYTFRSRLEARWAVFFNKIGLKWDYEIEGFELEDGTWYLPDFYIPEFGYIEIKAEGMVKDEEIRKCIMLSKLPTCVALFDGSPKIKEYSVWEDGKKNYCGFCTDSVINWGQIPFFGNPIPDEEDLKAINAACSEKFGQKGRTR